MLIHISPWWVSEEKLPDKECFYSSVKDGTTSDDGEKLDGHMCGGRNLKFGGKGGGV